MKGKQVRNKALVPILAFLWRGKVDMAITYLRGLNEDVIKNQAEIERLIGYFERNKGFIPYYALRQKLGLRVSSNLVEKANDLVVSDRQKHNGMSWSAYGSTSRGPRYLSPSKFRTETLVVKPRYQIQVRSTGRKSGGLKWFTCAPSNFTGRFFHILKGKQATFFIGIRYVGKGLEKTFEQHPDGGQTTSLLPQIIRKNMPHLSGLTQIYSLGLSLRRSTRSTMIPDSKLDMTELTVKVAVTNPICITEPVACRTRSDSATVAKASPTTERD